MDLYVTWQALDGATNYAPILYVLISYQNRLNQIKTW